MLLQKLADFAAVVLDTAVTFALTCPADTVANAVVVVADDESFQGGHCCCFLMGYVGVVVADGGYFLDAATVADP